MNSSTDKSTNAPRERKVASSAEKREAPKRQPDGSTVSTPPADPANSDETLKRNRTGHS